MSPPPKPSPTVVILLWGMILLAAFLAAFSPFIEPRRVAPGGPPDEVRLSGWMSDIRFMPGCRDIVCSFITPWDKDSEDYGKLLGHVEMLYADGDGFRREALPESVGSPGVVISRDGLRLVAGGDGGGGIGVWALPAASHSALSDDQTTSPRRLLVHEAFNFSFSAKCSAISDGPAGEFALGTADGKIVRVSPDLKTTREAKIGEGAIERLRYLPESRAFLLLADAALQLWREDLSSQISRIKLDRRVEGLDISPSGDLLVVFLSGEPVYLVPIHNLASAGNTRIQLAGSLRPNSGTYPVAKSGGFISESECIFLTGPHMLERWNVREGKRVAVHTTTRETQLLAVSAACQRVIIVSAEGGVAAESPADWK